MSAVTSSAASDVDSTANVLILYEPGRAEPWINLAPRGTSWSSGGLGTSATSQRDFGCAASGFSAYPRRDNGRKSADSVVRVLSQSLAQEFGEGAS